MQYTVLGSFFTLFLTEMEKLKAWIALVLVSTLPFALEAQLCFAPLPPESGSYNELRSMIYNIHVYSLIGVRLYLAKENRALKNYSFIRASQIFGDHPNGLWCQSASSFNESVDAGGGWYIPNGERVNFTDEASEPLHQEILANQFVLLRDYSINIPGHEGLYQCKIPYSDNNTSVLVIAIYANEPYGMNGTV